MVIKAILGGSFGYLQAAIIGVVSIGAVWMWRDYQGAKKDVTRLNGEVTELHGTIKSKDGTIASMGRTAARRDTDSNNSKDLGNDILKAKDGTHCGSSEPIRIALDGLRFGPAKTKPNATDKTIPVLAGAYPARD